MKVSNTSKNTITTGKASAFAIALWLFILLILLIRSPHVSGQDRILNKVEKDCKCPEFTRQSHFRSLMPIESSTNEVEIRLITYSMGPTQYYILKQNGRSYKAVNYRSKSPLSDYRLPKKGKSPYYRYLADSAGIDTVINKLIRLDIAGWKNPGLKITNIPDLGIMEIQYKIRNHTGSYRFQPPGAILKRYPDHKAYRQLTEIVSTIEGLPYAHRP